MRTASPTLWAADCAGGIGPTLQRSAGEDHAAPHVDHEHTATAELRANSANGVAHISRRSAVRGRVRSCIGGVEKAASYAGKRLNSFATPSPRLIPEGEKPDTFTGLALAPNEGRTKGRGRAVLKPDPAELVRLYEKWIREEPLDTFSPLCRKDLREQLGSDEAVRLVEAAAAIGGFADTQDLVLHHHAVGKLLQAKGVRLPRGKRTGARIGEARLQADELAALFGAASCGR